MCGERDEERLLAFIILPVLPLLYYQHTQQLATLDDRNTQEGAKTFFFYCRNIFKTWVLLRIRKVYRLCKTPNQSDNAFIKCECNGATTWLFKATCCHEIKAAPVMICEINRAYLGIHRKADVCNQNIQRLIEARGTGNLLDYFSQTGEHFSRDLTSFTSPCRRVITWWRNFL